MTENKMEALAKLFNVELYEEIEIEYPTNTTAYRYRFTKSGLEYFDTRDAVWVNDEATMLELIINSDLYNIKKLPWKPKDEEQFWAIYRDGDRKPEAGFSFWCDSITDKIFYKNGCVYRTQEECERNLKHDYEKLTGEQWQW